ncbi:MAG: hemolysin III family protein [Chloroflexi bacterium]|nr:hemolysin III family protein [Chloroflexota bacterium]
MNSRIALAKPPLLRGYIHLVVAVVTPFALVGLLLIADSPRDYAGAAIFGSSLILVYTTSAAYHVMPWNVRYRAIMRRLDHSMIFLFIAGTYTPFTLKLLGNAWGISILSVVWGLASVGIALKLIAPNVPRWLGVSLYIALGWVGLVPATQIAASLPFEALMLMIAGGLLYSVGGVFYMMRWPDPFPRVFGFHEIFHSMVALASVIFYFVVADYVLPI